VPVEGIRVSGRNTQGVRIMNLTPGDLVVDVARVVKEDEGDDGAAEEDEGEAPAGRSAKGGGKRGAKAGGRK